MLNRRPVITNQMGRNGKHVNSFRIFLTACTLPALEIGLLALENGLFLQRPGCDLSLDGE